ncbi:GTP cyclohydrolase II [Aestuariibius sp. 2305UL40-4]|uniref:GTP cyclohydrolase II n=1 Tax=Aestuariibius violaceus TaxID=3234132 RepID=UPI00345E548B
MLFTPTHAEQRSRAAHDLRLGRPVRVDGPEGGAAVFAAETLTEERLTQARAIGRPVLAITAWRAETLKVQVYDGDLARLAVPETEGLRWISGVIDPARDLSMPMKGPFKAERGGSADVSRAAISLAKGAHLLPAALLVPLSEPTPDLLSLTVEAALDDQLVALSPVSSARVPLAAAKDARLHIFREPGGEEHYAIEIGSPRRDAPVLARLHSACFTGDLLDSLKCDCGPQLRAALAQMGAEGSGILLYLNQEGRGIGLANKMRAYDLQDQGFDTVDANHRLGFEDDERDFRIGAQLLRSLGVSQVRLMTNNPAKIARMESCDIAVAERVPLRVGETPENSGYLATKIAKSGHLT